MGQIRINEKYRPLWNTKKRYIIVTGGRGSGKSWVVNTFLNQLLLELGHNILFTRYTLTSANKSIIPEFREKTVLLGLTDKIKSTQSSVECVNGNILYFSGIKTSEGIQTAALKSIPNLTTWVMDEAEELPNIDLFNTIDDSIRRKGFQNRVIIVMNPTDKTSWIYKRFFEKKRDNVEYIHTTYLDNLDNISDSFIEKANLAKIEEPAFYANNYLGEWAENLKGLIYSFKEIDNYQDIQGQTIYGMDFGFNDPNVIVEIKIKENNAYISEVLYKSGLLIPEVIEVLNSSGVSKTNDIIGDCARPDAIEEIHRSGYNIYPCKKYSGSKFDGIQAVKRFNLFIDSNSLNLLKEIKHYRWKEDKNGDSINEPIGFNDHAMDSMAYAFHHLLKDSFVSQGNISFIESPGSRKRTVL